MTQWHGGKGSSPRPFSVDRKKFEDNWDRIFNKKNEELSNTIEEKESKEKVSDKTSSD